jgi:ATP-binding cassette subfamily B (MDR/TAP) protein 1
MGVWGYTSEISSKRMREKYLQSVLRQDVAFFDDLSAGEVATRSASHPFFVALDIDLTALPHLSRIQTDTHLFQLGISEKVALATSYISTFITGFVLAYARSWRLALALSAILPCIGCSGTAMSIFVTKYKSLTLKNVAASGGLAEEVSLRRAPVFSLPQLNAPLVLAGHLIHPNRSRWAHFPFPPETAAG